LVIGFIVALPFFFETGIFVSQPSVTKAAPGRETDVKVNILLTNDGNIVLNDERIISKESLTTLLPKLLARSVSKRVIVSSEEKVRYDDVVQILDLAKQSGAANLCLLRQRKK